MSKLRWVLVVGVFFLGAAMAGTAQTAIDIMAGGGSVLHFIGFAVGGAFSALAVYSMGRIAGPDRYASLPYPGFRRWR